VKYRFSTTWLLSNLGELVLWLEEGTRIGILGSGLMGAKLGTIFARLDTMLYSYGGTS
jgi:hypothetical protein